MSKVRNHKDPITVTYPGCYVVCRKHNDLAVVYSGDSYKSCPFCVAQNMINPLLKSTSLIKNGNPNKKVVTDAHTDESVSTEFSQNMHKRPEFEEGLEDE